jgi:hypothetical protein
MTTTALKAIDSGLSPSVTVGYATASTYCLKAPGQASTTWYFAGPGGTVTSTAPANC